MVNKNIYALVTGGTQGIGRYLANLLAGAGYNLIVAGQSRERLSALCSDIQSRFPVTVHTYETDLVSSDDASVPARNDCTSFRGVDQHSRRQTHEYSTECCVYGIDRLSGLIHVQHDFGIDRVGNFGFQHSFKHDQKSLRQKSRQIRIQTDGY